VCIFGGDLLYVVAGSSGWIGSYSIVSLRMGCTQSVNALNLILIVYSNVIKRNRL